MKSDFQVEGEHMGAHRDFLPGWDLKTRTRA